MHLDYSLTEEFLSKLNLLHSLNSCCHGNKIFAPTISLIVQHNCEFNWKKSRPHLHHVREVYNRNL